MKLDLEEGPDVAEHPPANTSRNPNKARVILGVHLEHWIPLGGWRDALVGDYDYSYLFLVGPA